MRAETCWPFFLILHATCYSPKFSLSRCLWSGTWFFLGNDNLKFGIGLNDLSFGIYPSKMKVSTTGIKGVKRCYGHKVIKWGFSSSCLLHILCFMLIQVECYNKFPTFRWNHFKFYHPKGRVSSMTKVKNFCQKYLFQFCHWHSVPTKTII